MLRHFQLQFLKKSTFFMDKKIIIVGAGPSGVAAATRLISKEFKNVTILEAENRIGGRVHTIPFGANVVDLGAQWCHGEKDNVVYEMAKDKNVLAGGSDFVMLEKFVRSNGEEIPSELTAKITALAFEIYEGDSYDEEKTAYRGPLGNFFAEKFISALKTDEYKGVDSELTHECFEFFHKLMNSLDGADSWYETSCDLHEYETCEGDRLLDWKDKGYATVFDLLQNKIRGADKTKQVLDIIPLVQFNKEVRKIVYNQPDGSIKIHCVDGSSFTADHLICTVSLGVLKERHVELFQPLLPLWKFNAIDGMTIGTADKIFLEFDRPFWPDNWPGFSCLWKIEQIKEVRKDPVNGDWLEGLMGFYPFNRLQPNMLCGWVVGSMAQKMEQKSDADVKAGVEKVLRMFLKNQHVPNVKAMVRSKWHSNPHFRGSYSSYTLKAEALGASTHTLAEPIRDFKGNPIIQFAGEATSPKFYGCVHGAIETGWREADRIINLYQKLKSRL